MCEVRINAESGDFLSLTVHRPTLRNDTDYWVGNWTNSIVDVAAGGFRGTVTGCIHADELRGFRDRLTELYDRLKGRVVFETMEHWLRIEISGDGRGHFVGRCVLSDDPADGNTLDFRLRFDQTYLPAVIGDLNAVLADFPVLGRP